METQTKSTLASSLKFHQLFSLSFGVIVGVGWVILAGDWITQAGSVGAVIAFLLGGLGILLVALCYAEVSSLFPATGGEMVFAYRLFGLKTAFVSGWLLALLYLSVCCFEAISVGLVASYLLPDIQGPVLYRILGQDVRLGGVLLAFFFTLLIAVMNFRGARTAAVFQDVMTYGLLLITVVFVAAAIGGGSVRHMEPWFTQDQGVWNWKGFTRVLVTTPFFFAGFNVISQALGEIKGVGGKLIARMNSAVILASIGFYTAVIVATSVTLPAGQLKELELPVANAIDKGLNNPILGKLVLITAFLGLITTWNGVFFAATRVLYALGHSRIIASFFGQVHPRFGTPGIAVVFVALVTFLGILLGGGLVLPVVAVAGICLVFQFFIVSAGSLRLRRMKGVTFPYRIPGGWFVPGLAAAFSGALLLQSLYQPWLNIDSGIPVEWLVLGSWTLLGLAVWPLTRRVRAGIPEEEREKRIMGER